MVTAQKKNFPFNSVSFHQQQQKKKQKQLLLKMAGASMTQGSFRSRNLHLLIQFYYKHDNTGGILPSYTMKCHQLR